MGTYKTKIKIAKTFEEREVVFPVFIKENFLTYYQFCTAETYIKVESYDNKTSIEYFDACPYDHIETLKNLLQNKDSVEITKKEFDDIFEKAEKYIKSYKNGKQ